MAGRRSKSNKEWRRHHPVMPSRFGESKRTNPKDAELERIEREGQQKETKR